jgi:hypothetical protein
MTAGALDNAHKLSLRGGHATSVVIPRLRCEHWGTRGPAPAALVRTGEKPASIDISISRPLKRGRLATSGAPSLPAYVAPWWLRLRPGRNAVPGGHARRALAAARRFQGPAGRGPAFGRRGQCQAPPEALAPPVSNAGRAPSRDRASRWHLRRMCGHGRPQRPSAPMFRLRWHHDQKRAFHGQLQL